MKKIFATALLSATLFVSPAQAAVTVNFTGGASALDAGLSIIQTFETFANNASIGTNANVYSASVPGLGAQPAFDSTGNYAAVRAGGSYQVNFQATDVFSVVIGSLDTFNSLELLFADATSTLYQGGQIINGLSFPNGNQISGLSNGRVTYSNAGGPSIVGVIFSSGGNSFEFDNLAAAIPEPGTWAMMLAGFGAMGVAMRRRRRVAVSFA